MKLCTDPLEIPEPTFEFQSKHRFGVGDIVLVRHNNDIIAFNHYIKKTRNQRGSATPVAERFAGRLVKIKEKRMHALKNPWYFIEETNVGGIWDEEILRLATQEELNERQTH